jgi:drug/metabolite transporter (DMT)-like permease
MATELLNKNDKKSSMTIYHIGALLAISVWGLSFVSTKVLLENGLGPAEIYIYRFVLAYLIILLISHKRILCNTLKDEFAFAVCGLLAGSLYFIAENNALEYTLVTNVSLLTSLSPLITTLLIGLVYKNERPSRGVVIGSLIAFIGVGCVIFNSSTNFQVNPLGDLLSIIAAVCWAVYSIVLRRLTVNYDTWFVTRKTFFYGVVTAVPFMIFGDSGFSPHLLMVPAVYLNIGFLGLFASLLAYVLWSFSIKGLGAVRTSNYMYFQPVLTMVASVILLGERISLIGYLGCALILGGLWLGDWLSKRMS